MSQLPDLALLPPPQVIEELSFEAILATRKARYLALHPADQQDAVALTLELESEPVVKLLQEAAYTELLLRQRINEAAKASMLAYAQGADLDNLVALLGIARLSGELDRPLRERALLSYDGYSSAGPVNAYIAAARAVDASIVDVSVTSPSPGVVNVYLLAKPSATDAQGLALANELGVPSPALVARVQSALSAHDVRPLDDLVTVSAAQPITYTLRATLTLAQGAMADIAVQAATLEAQVAATQACRLGTDLPLSMLYAALQQSGVYSVTITEPADSITIAAHQAAHCLDIILTVVAAP